MAAIGDLVKCVNAEASWIYPLCCLEVGKFYKITDISSATHEPYSYDLVFRVEGGGDAWWMRERFEETVPDDLGLHKGSSEPLEPLYRRITLD